MSDQGWTCRYCGAEFPTKLQPCPMCRKWEHSTTCDGVAASLADAKKTMIRALRCLYIAVEEDVADDVATKVKAYTDMLETANMREAK